MKSLEEENQLVLSNDSFSPRKPEYDDVIGEERKLDPLTESRILHANLGANICFCVGAFSLSVFSYYELKNRCPDFDGANEIYLLGFCGFSISGLVELFIDLRFSHHVNLLRRSRYTTQLLLNLTISILFTTGNVFDLAAFFIWHTQNWPLEHRMLFVTSYVWLAVGILVQVTVVRPSHFVGPKNWSLWFDAVGNTVFLIGAIFDLASRHMADLVERQQTSTYRVGFIASILWVFNAVLFLIGSCLRIRNFKANRKNERMMNGDAAAAAAVVPSQGQVVEMATRDGDDGANRTSRDDLESQFEKSTVADNGVQNSRPSVDDPLPTLSHRARCISAD